jgi:hypothetical protein
MPDCARTSGQDGTTAPTRSCAGCLQARLATSSTSIERQRSSRCSRRTSSTAASADSSDEAEPRCARNGACRRQSTTCSSSTATGSAPLSPDRGPVEHQRNHSSVQRGMDPAGDAIFCPTATATSGALRRPGVSERTSHMPRNSSTDQIGGSVCGAARFSFGSVVAAGAIRQRMWVGLGW